MVEGILVALGHVVRETRRERWLTQEELAVRVEVHETYISLIELGRRNPTVGTLRKIGDALQVPASELMREAEAHERQQNQAGSN